MDPFIDPDRLSGTPSIAVGVADVSELLAHSPFQAGLFPHLSYRRLIDALAFLDVSLGQSPATANTDQRDLDLAGVPSINHAAGRHLSHRAHGILALCRAARHL